MTEPNPQQELLTSVLAVTRDQLTKSMNLTAELEALLMVERKKNAELQHQVRLLESKYIVVPDDKPSGGKDV